MGDPSQFAFDFQAPPERRIWKVGELIATLRTRLEREYTDVWVEGEISNLRPAGSGHLYFTLNDGEAQLRIVIFRMQARRLRFKPENGLSVIARGRLSVYENRGELQLIGEFLEPVGAGALQVAFEQLKKKLAAEGLFDSGRKKAIPLLPRCIGVVTSPHGAAIQDILNILRRRHQSVDVLIYPAQVQGEAAAREVASGVRYFSRSRQVDVVIIARGGGSFEDLAAFNDESLARAVAESTLPVISAVGHETDFTICDFVADLRAPTPSAAAELVVRSKDELQERLAGLHARLGRGARYGLLMARQRLSLLTQSMAFTRMQELIARRQQRVDELAFRLTAAQQKQLRTLRRRVDVAVARLRHQEIESRLRAMRRELAVRVGAFGNAMRHLIDNRKAGLQRLGSQLQALSPLGILERGYALVFDEQGKLVTNSTQLSPGQQVRGRVAHGSFTARVERTEPEGDAEARSSNTSGE
jgi:exodeoxyribonuclease VII large subunit